MTARENILARIRAKSGRIGTTSDAERAEVRRAMAMHARGPLPAMAAREPIQHFIDECARLKTTVAELSNVDAVPGEVARYLAQESLSTRLVGWPEFAALKWAEVGLTFENRPANGDDLIGFTGSYCAIGETGTLLLLGARETPKATALLPETHVCVVKKSRIVPTMEDVFALMRAEIGEPPRATFFVSGPSRTADIEQTLVIGAHGPYRVHVILIP